VQKKKNNNNNNNKTKTQMSQQFWSIQKTIIASYIALFPKLTSIFVEVWPTELKLWFRTWIFSAHQLKNQQSVKGRQLHMLYYLHFIGFLIDNTKMSGSRERLLALGSHLNENGCKILHFPFTANYHRFCWYFYNNKAEIYQWAVSQLWSFYRLCVPYVLSLSKK